MIASETMLLASRDREAAANNSGRPGTPRRSRYEIGRSAMVALRRHVDDAHAGFFDVALPVFNQRGKALRFARGEVVGLARIGAEIVELPHTGTVRRGDQQRLPVATPDGAAAEQLPARRGVVGVHDVALAA